MSEFIEFGSKDAADAAREEHSQYRCPVDDDRRKRTVAFISDTPDELLDAIKADAEESRAASEATTGQADLTDREREQIDFAADGANVPKARSVKAIADEMGVDQWVEAFDPRLTVDEHRGVLERFNRSTAGDRVDRDDAQQRQQAAAARESAEQCNHAEGACRNGQPDACEFLQTACGFDESEVEDLLPTLTDGGVETERDEDADPLVVDVAAVPDPDERVASPPTDDRPADEIESDQDGEAMREPEIDDDQGRLDATSPFAEPDADLTGKQLGALSRSANGYKGAVAELREAVMTAKEAMKNAQMAAGAIDGIREEAGQPPTHFTALEDANAAVMDLVRMSAEVCVECHGEHADHDHDVTDGDREDLREFVGGGATTTPVGVSDETEDKITDSLDVPEMVAGFELTDPDPRNLVYEASDGRRVEIYSHGGDMSHHYSAILRAGDETRQLADATADRMAADDMGAEQNRERAVDAAVDYMRSEPADGSVESPSMDVGRSIQMPDEPAIQREATRNLRVQPLVETDLPARLTQSFVLEDFGERYAIYRDDDGAEIEAFAVDGEPRFRITDTEGRTRDEGRAGGLVPALEEARQRVDRMARESSPSLRLSDVAVPDSIGQFGFLRRSIDSAIYSHPATGDKLILSDTGSDTAVELMVRGDSSRSRRVDDVRTAVDVATDMADRYQRRRNQTREPPVDPDAVPGPDERLSSAGTTPDRDEVIDLSQRTLGGGTRAQSTLVGGETGERGQGEVESGVVGEVNDGGLMEDSRDDPTDFDPDEDTEQMVPDEFQTTDNDQDTL